MANTALVPLSQDADRYDEMNRVMTEFLKRKNPTQIARETGLKRVQVLAYIEEWKEIAQNDETIKLRAREALHDMDQTYSLLTGRFWKIADETVDEKNELAALKHIADIEKVRQQTLRDAGLYDDAVLGDQVAEVEQQMEQIKAFLLELANSHPSIKGEILAGLSKIFRKAEEIVIVEVEKEA